MKAALALLIMLCALLGYVAGHGGRLPPTKRLPQQIAGWKWQGQGRNHQEAGWSWDGGSSSAIPNDSISNG